MGFGSVDFDGNADSRLARSGSQSASPAQTIDQIVTIAHFQMLASMGLVTSQTSRKAFMRTSCTADVSSKRKTGAKEKWRN